MNSYFSPKLAVRENSELVNLLDARLYCLKLAFAKFA